MGLFASLFGRKVAAVWEGTTFHEGDRIISRDSSRYTTVKPEVTGHRVDVLLGDGKTGTVVKGIQGRNDGVYIKWDRQKWREAGQRKREYIEPGDSVGLPSFEHCLHVDYVRPTSKDP